MTELIAPFSQYLLSALMIDYYNVSYLVGGARASGRDVLCKQNIAGNWFNVFNQLGAKYKIFDCTTHAEYCWITFDDDADKDLVDDYFAQFNANNRVIAGIPQPDVYEERAEPVLEVCNYYLHVIEKYVAENMVGQIAIPFGLEDDESRNRMFVVADKDEILGLVEGRRIFGENKIAYVY